MQLIAVDIGNSSTKIAVDHAGEDHRWSLQQVLRGDEVLVEKTLDLESDSCFWSISSVNQTRLNRLEKWVANNRPNDTVHVISADDIELKTDVKSREQLGRDRLVAAWMAVELDDHSVRDNSSRDNSARDQSGPLVVVDAGTAVTIDYVDVDEVFLGGVIYPGAESNFRQLAQHTDALPDLSRDARLGQRYDDCIGKSTRDAILKGVFQSQAWAILGIVKQLQSRSRHETAVYLTGGGIVDLIEFFPDQWNDVPDLVLQGAKEIGARLVSQLK